MKFTWPCIDEETYVPGLFCIQMISEIPRYFRNVALSLCSSGAQSTDGSWNKELCSIVITIHRAREFQATSNFQALRFTEIEMSLVPPIPGPKLGPFNPYSWPLIIDFVELLGIGANGHVWKVRIEKQIYALKIVSEYITPYTKSLLS